MTLQDAVELAFLHLEETYNCTWRTGKGTRENLIAALSQTQVPAHQYLGYQGSDGLRHVFARSIPELEKNSREQWRPWLLSLINCRYCDICNNVHDLSDHTDITCTTPIKTQDRSVGREKVSQFICEYLLSHPCEICGETDIVVLEFDHLDPDIKSFDIGARAARGLKTVSEEISKCRVLCSNCHKRHTAKTQKHYKYLFSELFKSNIP